MARPDPFTKQIFESGHKRRRKSRKRFLGPLMIASLLGAVTAAVLLFAWLSERRVSRLAKAETAALRAELENYRDPVTGPLAEARFELGRLKERVRDLEQSNIRLRRSIEDRPANLNVPELDNDESEFEKEKRAEKARADKAKAEKAKADRARARTTKPPVDEDEPTESDEPR